MYSVNQPGESKNFDEKTVSELHNKVFNLLYNVLAFYELYRDKELEKSEYKNSENILDQWIVARFNELVENTTKQLDGYKLLEPVRSIREFIDDLSTWYVRRSRERLKNGDEEAKHTLYFVLKITVQLFAPFMPFIAEDIWQKLKFDSDPESYVSYSSNFFWTRVSFMLAPLLILLFLKVFKKSIKKPSHTGKKMVGNVFLVLINKSLAGIAALFNLKAIQVAVNPAWVQSMSGLQYVLLFLFLISFRKFPNNLKSPSCNS
jgi:hypothetical protein